MQTRQRSFLYGEAWALEPQVTVCGIYSEYCYRGGREMLCEQNSLVVDKRSGFLGC